MDVRRGRKWRLHRPSCPTSMTSWGVRMTIPSAASRHVAAIASPVHPALLSRLVACLGASHPAPAGEGCGAPDDDGRNWPRQTPDGRSDLMSWRRVSCSLRATLTRGMEARSLPRCSYGCFVRALAIDALSRSPATLTRLARFTVNGIAVHDRRSRHRFPSRALSSGFSTRHASNVCHPTHTHTQFGTEPKTVNTSPPPPATSRLAKEPRRAIRSNPLCVCVSVRVCVCVWVRVCVCVMPVCAPWRRRRWSDR